MYYRLGERLLELAITIPARIILLPMLALVALLVRVKLGSPVLFYHGCAGALTVSDRDTG